MPSERIRSESKEQYGASEPRDVPGVGRYRFVGRGGKMETAAAGRCSRHAKRTGSLLAFIAVRCQRSLLELETSVSHLDEGREM
jgi:hypothetical protein